ncbi:DUF6907 domain-containing protein [Micromonospora sp. NPDC005113]
MSPMDHARWLSPPEVPPCPRWCVKGLLCREDGMHASRPAPANTSDATAPIRVWLEQRHRPADARPMVVIEVSEGSGEVRYFWLPIEQARQLAFQIRRIVR